MENYKLDQDIKVFYVTASSFPDGILAAHQKLHSLVPFSETRKYFGVSRPENGAGIVYRSAAEELSPGEGKSLGCETMVLKKGTYVSIVLHDYMNDLQGIGLAFDELLKHSDLDPEGYCVEWYLSQKEVRCMVRLSS